MEEVSAWLAQKSIPWPPNLWAGTSITTQATTSRINPLLQVGDEQTIRFLSVESQWEAIDFSESLPKLDWIIQGGEAGGSEAQPFNLQWAREMRQQCADAKVPYFLKQLGCNAFDGDKRIKLKDSHGGDWKEWPTELKVRKMPKGL